MAKNTAPVDSKNTQAAVEDEWEREQLGFPPYWDPKEGDSVQCMIQSLDETDPQFPRYICVYTGNGELQCSKGAKDSSAFEEVIVYPGEQFSMSEWAGIARDRIVPYIGIDIRLTRSKETKLEKDPETGAPRTFINWDLMVKKSDRPLIAQRKAQMLEARKEANQLNA